jgi:hypothetical protein
VLNNSRPCIRRRLERAERETGIRDRSLCFYKAVLFP